MKHNTVASRLLQILFLVFMTFLFVYPFWWMFCASLNDNATIFSGLNLLPQKWKWSNYTAAFQMQPFARQYLNTLLVTLVGSIGNVALAAMAGYAYARIRFPGRGGMFILLLTGLMMPIEVVIIPLYFEMNLLGLADSYYPLILVAVFGGQGAFSTFMFRQFYITVPTELAEAARVDGLGYFGTFTRIMLPIAKPVISSALILAFLSVWNMYLEPLVFISSVDRFVLSQALNNFSDNYGAVQYPVQMAATAMAVLPVMLVYLFLQDKVVDAMVNSGVKG